MVAHGDLSKSGCISRTSGILNGNIRDKSPTSGFTKGKSSPTTTYPLRRFFLFNRLNTCFFPVGNGFFFSGLNPYISLDFTCEMFMILWSRCPSQKSFRIPIMGEFRNPARQLAKVAFTRQTKTWLSLEVNKQTWEGGTGQLKNVSIWSSNQYGDLT